MAATTAKGSPEGDRPVTVHECDQKHRATRTQLTFMLAMMSIFLVGVGWAALSGYLAQSKAFMVETELKAHNSAQTEMVKRIEQKLDAIDRGVEDNRAELREQRKLIEDLWRSGHPASGGGPP